MCYMVFFSLSGLRDWGSALVIVDQVPAECYIVDIQAMSLYENFDWMEYAELKAHLHTILLMLCGSGSQHGTRE